MKYGLSDKGFVKKPYDKIVAELEDSYRDIFGSAINLEPQSPQGQLIGITSEAIYDVWEMAEHIYSSFNIDNVNNHLLDDRARLRDISRFENESDEELKIRIKEQLPNDVLKLRDELDENLKLLNGVKDVTVRYSKGVTSVFILGGDDTEIANTILDYMPPGLMRGNTSIDVHGRCKNVKFYRPIFKPIKIEIAIEYFSHLECECSIADIEKMKTAIIESSCGLGYGEFLYAEYIKNIIIRDFSGIRVSNINLYTSNSIDTIECNNNIVFSKIEEFVEVEEWEKVLLCIENIFIEAPL